MKDFIRESLTEHDRIIIEGHEFGRGTVYYIVERNRLDKVDGGVLNEPGKILAVHQILEELIAEGVIRTYNKNNHASMTVWERV